MGTKTESANTSSNGNGNSKYTKALEAIVKNVNLILKAKNGGQRDPHDPVTFSRDSQRGESKPVEALRKVCENNKLVFDLDAIMNEAAQHSTLLEIKVIGDGKYRVAFMPEDAVTANQLIAGITLD